MASCMYSHQSASELVGDLAKTNTFLTEHLLAAVSNCLGKHVLSYQYGIKPAESARRNIINAMEISELASLQSDLFFKKNKRGAPFIRDLRVPVDLKLQPRILTFLLQLRRYTSTFIFN